MHEVQLDQESADAWTLAPGPWQPSWDYTDQYLSATAGSGEP